MGYTYLIFIGSMEVFLKDIKKDSKRGNYCIITLYKARKMRAVMGITSRHHCTYSHIPLIYSPLGHIKHKCKSRKEEVCGGCRVRTRREKGEKNLIMPF